MHFPTWRYHRDGRAVIVHSLEELEQLGEGWADNPGKFEPEDSPFHVPGLVVEEPKAGADSVENSEALCIAEVPTVLQGNDFDDTPDRDEAGRIRRTRRGRRG